MKKHIIGLALFSFIVTTAAVIYGFLSFPKIIPVPAPQYSPASAPTSCWKMKRERKELKSNSIEVKQAVFDTETRQFNWELETPNKNEPIELHFFIKDEKGTRYITSEQVTNEQVTNKLSHNGILRFSNSYDWLNKRRSFENLYVIAQFESDATNYNENFQVYGNKFQPKFDAMKATAVTVDYGK